MDDVCRTCLRIINFNETAIPIDVRVRKQLRICFPELVAGKVVDPVICLTCDRIIPAFIWLKGKFAEAEKKIARHLLTTNTGEIIPVGKMQMLTLARYDLDEFIIENASLAKEVTIETTPRRSEIGSTAGPSKSRSSRVASSRPHLFGPCSGDSRDTCNWDNVIGGGQTPNISTVITINDDFEEDDDVYDISSPSDESVEFVDTRTEQNPNAAVIESVEIVDLPTELVDDNPKTQSFNAAVVESVEIVDTPTELVDDNPKTQSFNAAVVESVEIVDLPTELVDNNPKTQSFNAAVVESVEIVDTPTELVDVNPKAHSSNAAVIESVQIVDTIELVDKTLRTQSSNAAVIETNPTKDFSGNQIESDEILEIIGADTVGTVVQFTTRSESVLGVVENNLPNNSNELVRKSSEVTTRSASPKVIAPVEPQHGLVMEVEQIENTPTNEVQRPFNRRRSNYDNETHTLFVEEQYNTSKKRKLPLLSEKLSKSNEELPNSEAIPLCPDHIDNSDNVMSAKTDFITTKPETKRLSEPEIIGDISSIERTKYTTFGLNREVEVKFRKGVQNADLAIQLKDTKEPSRDGVTLQTDDMMQTPKPKRQTVVKSPQKNIKKNDNIKNTPKRKKQVSCDIKSKGSANFDEIINDNEDIPKQGVEQKPLAADSAPCIQQLTINTTVINITSHSNSKIKKKPSILKPEAKTKCKDSVVYNLRKRHTSQHCKQCDKPYTCTSSPKSKDLKCELCDKTFHTKNELSSHTALHFSVGDFQCSICKKYFSSDAVLKKHGQNHHQI